MDDVTKRAIENLRAVATVYRHPVVIGEPVGGSCMRAAEIIDAACAMMEGDNGAFGNLIEFALFKCDKCGEEQRAMAGVKSMHICPQDRIADFRERVILALIARRDTALAPVESEEQIPATCALFGKLVTTVADAIVSAAYPQPKKETA